MTTLALVQPTTIRRQAGFSTGSAPGSLSSAMHNDVNDETLMLRYQRGDGAAFDVLFHRYKDAIFRYLQRQCSHSMAEEVFQDVWMNLVQARHQFRIDGSSRFVTYLYRIAHNRLMDYFRQNSVQDRVFSSRDDDMDQFPSATPTLPDRALDTQRKVDLLLDLIDRLPADQRQAFLLREEGGLGIQEIADVTGVSRETAKSRLRYAFARLRDGMGEMT